MSMFCIIFLISHNTLGTVLMTCLCTCTSSEVKNVYILHKCWVFALNIINNISKKTAMGRHGFCPRS